MLDLAPETESRIQAYAAHEGVDADEAINRLLRIATTNPRLVPADDPVLRFLSDQLQEAEHATPEEIAAADAELRQLQQAMNETRRANDERLLYPEATQQ